MIPRFGPAPDLGRLVGRVGAVFDAIAQHGSDDEGIYPAAGVTVLLVVALNAISDTTVGPLAIESTPPPQKP